MKSKKCLICVRVCLAAWVLGFSGCATVGPDYAPPEQDIPAAWESLAADDQDKASAQSPAAWWTCLDDPLLSDIISRVFDNNNDLKEALARVREVRERKYAADTDRWPSINATASEKTSKGSRNMGGGESRDLYTAGLDAGWEIDLFGGVRRSVEAASAELDAAVYSYRNVMVSLAAEAALTYAEWRTYDKRLEVAKENLTLQTETYDMVRAKYEAGLATAVGLNQAITSLETLRAGIPDLETGRRQSLNRLAVLMGRFPENPDGVLSSAGSLPVPPSDIAVGIPAEVLRQRPDVQMAERNLAAQTAKIGVAEARRYPTLTLSGSIGIEALSPADLLTTDAISRSLGPSLSQRLFDAGALKRSVNAQEAVADQAFFQYRSALLTALEEVENALTAYAGERRRLAALTSAAQSAAEAFELAKARYASGLIDFQALLDSQKALLSAEDSVILSKGAIITDFIRLYKALGGGWTTD